MRADGSIIKDLYDASSTSISVMDHMDSRSGFTISLAMIFSMLTGRHAATLA